jgi:hypothetical protein
LAGPTWYAGGGAAVLEGLVRTRLVTADDQTVQIAHEALIREWPRLREWLDADRAGERLRRGVQSAAREWDEHGRDPSYLFEGARLVAAREWTGANPGRLDALGAAFLDASIAEVERETREIEIARQRELEQAQALAAAEARRSSVIRNAALASIVLTVIALGVAWFALDQRSQARLQEERADNNLQLAQNAEATAVAEAIQADWERAGAVEARETSEAALAESKRQAAISLSRSLVIEARENSTGNPSLALILAVEALRAFETVEAIDQLRVSMVKTGIQRLVLPMPSGQSSTMSLVWSNQGSDLLILSEKTVSKWNVESSKVIELSSLSNEILEGMWSTDDSRVMVVTENGGILILNAQTGAVLSSLEYDQPLVGVAWSADEDAIIASTADGEVVVWDDTLGSILASAKASDNLFSRSASCRQNLPAASAISDPRLEPGWSIYEGEVFCDPSGRRAMFGEDNELIIVNLMSRQREALVRSSGRTFGIHAGRLWSPLANRVLTIDYAILKVLDSRNGFPLEEMPHNGLVFYAWWSNDSTRIATVAEDGPIHIWDADSATEVAAIDTFGYPISDVLWSPTDEFIFAQAPGQAPPPPGQGPNWEGPFIGVWYADNGLPLMGLPNDIGFGNASWNSDASMLLTSNWSEAVVWEIKSTSGSLNQEMATDELLYMACNRIGRNLTWLEWQQYFSDEPYRQTCPNLPVHFTVPEVARP